MADIGAKEVHVWRASLDLSTKSVEQLRQLLSPDELARAQRFHFDRDRKHFIVGRGCLRRIVSGYLNMPAAEIAFSYGDNGKPKLNDSYPHTQPLYFNLAHSGGLAVYAITTIGEIGIDLERINSEVTGDEIAKRFFSPNEVTCLNSVPAELRHEAFFNCWTRKEAFIKAKGIGLSLPLDQFEVTLVPGEPAKLLCTNWDKDEAPRWSMSTIDVGQDYVAAVAIETQHWHLRYEEFDSSLLEF